MVQRSTSTMLPNGVPYRSAAPAQSLGIKADNVIKLAQKLKQGLPYAALTRFQKRSGLSVDVMGDVIQIPRRTLARRKAEGQLTPQESERLYRLAQVFEKAVELFEGDVAGARHWLESPCKALAGQSPLGMAETEVGAREVENLIGRLEHGVFT